jgi:transposase
VFFDYTANRAQRRLLELLRHYKGYLQADGYKGYEAVYQGGDIVEVACWAQARAKFESAKKRTASPFAQLYQIEADI